MGLNKLSYETYGNLVVITLILLALLLNLFPFDFQRFVICVIQIPIYLIVRDKFKEPIHANGLNLCYFLTNMFYILLFLIIRLADFLINETFSFGLASVLCILGCYATSTLPNHKEANGKLFFGKRAENGRYADLFRLIKFEPTNKELCAYEDRLRDTDKFTYYIFKYIFRDGKTWDETMELLDINDRKDLDKEIYAIYRTLQYVCDLKRLD